MRKPDNMQHTCWPNSAEYLREIVFMEIESVAVVTGASQGIGRAAASRLARDFSAVVLVARDKENLEAAASEVSAVGADAMAFAIDLRLPQSADTVVKGTLDRFGRIDALLNIAGAVPQIDLFQMTDAEWDDGMALKLHGTRRLTIRAWDSLKASKGSVVLISGSAALEPKSAFAAVAATYAAIKALAEAFAERGIKDGIQVNSIVPGAVMTGRRRSFLEKWASAHNNERRGGRPEVSRRSRHKSLWPAGRNCWPYG
jgi:3-oxoacyl-[acyl-carrier protein] reductase